MTYWNDSNDKRLESSPRCPFVTLSQTASGAAARGVPAYQVRDGRHWRYACSLAAGGTLPTLMTNRFRSAR
jgi:hypothetical protein